MNNRSLPLERTSQPRKRKRASIIGGIAGAFVGFATFVAAFEIPAEPPIAPAEHHFGNGTATLTVKIFGRQLYERSIEKSESGSWEGWLWLYVPLALTIVAGAFGGVFLVRKLRHENACTEGEAQDYGESNLKADR
jgi:hypothetical protein